MTLYTETWQLTSPWGIRYKAHGSSGLWIQLLNIHSSLGKSNRFIILNYLWKLKKKSVSLRNGLAKTIAINMGHDRNLSISWKHGQSRENKHCRTKPQICVMLVELIPQICYVGVTKCFNLLLTFKSWELSCKNQRF